MQSNTKAEQSNQDSESKEIKQTQSWLGSKLNDVYLLGSAVAGGVANQASYMSGQVMYGSKKIANKTASTVSWGYASLCSFFSKSKPLKKSVFNSSGNFLATRLTIEICEKIDELKNVKDEQVRITNILVFNHLENQFKKYPDKSFQQSVETTRELCKRVKKSKRLEEVLDEIAKSSEKKFLLT